MQKFVLLILIFIINSCSQQQKESITHSNIHTDTLKIEFAKGFKIIDKQEYTEIQIFDPWQGARGKVFSYKLNNDSLKAKSLQHFYKSPSRFVCMSTTHVALLTALDCRKSITAISGAKFVYDSVLSVMIKNGEIADAGYDQQLDLEKMFVLKPNAIFAFGINEKGNSWLQKAENLGIPVVWVADYLESHPLGKLEWIKVFGEFCNKREFANQYFDSVKQNYNVLKMKVNKQSNKMIISSLPYMGVWYISGKKSYLVQMIHDAGASYIGDNLDSHESIALNIEQVFVKGREADVWINTDMAKTRKEMLQTDERLQYFKAFISRNIYSNIKRMSKEGGNDYWESGITNPDKILNDFIEILSNDTTDIDKRLHFYKKIN